MSDASSPTEHPPLTDTDRTFLRAIADIPDDRTTWLVYADWLDDRGDPRAEFLRLVVARDQPSEGDPEHAQTDARFAQLKAELDPRWLAAFDPARVVAGCPSAWQGTCGRVWTDLAPTDAPDVRICWECRKPVFYGHTAEEAALLAACNQIVALSTRVPPEQNPFPPPPPTPSDSSGEFVLDFGLVLPLPPMPVAALPVDPPRPWWKFW